jgi:phospholipid/cholesterol/gamma-HCH transport system ATP-binding protein
MPSSPSPASEAASPADRPLDLSVRDLSIALGDNMLLQNLEFDVYHGEIFVVLAQGGAGKTSLFRTLLGLVPPTSGRVSLLGKNLDGVRARELAALRKRVGAAYQDGALFDTLSVLENVKFPLVELADADAETVDIVARMKLTQVDLLAHADASVETLSAVLTRRASIARAIALDPKLLICDDIFSGIDRRSSDSLMELMGLLRDAFDMTVVILTSQFEVALLLADRVAVVEHGRIAACGTPDEIRESERAVFESFLADPEKRSSGEDILSGLYPAGPG